MCVCIILISVIINNLNVHPPCLKFCGKSDGRLMIHLSIDHRGRFLVYLHTTHNIYIYMKKNIEDIFVIKIHTHNFTQAQPLRLAHLPPAPSPPSACVCRSCRPSPAARSSSSPSSRRRRPSAARTCGRNRRRGRRRLQRDAEGGEASVFYIFISGRVTCNYLCTFQHNIYST